MLEKAFAKLNQNYDRIIAGNGAEGLRSLTGMPVIDLRHDESWYSNDQLLQVYKYFAKKNFPSNAGCCLNGGTYGLVSGHAYSFLDVAELKDGSGKVVHTIVKMRNPWSSESYNGPWRDNDPNWTAAWKK